MQGRSRTSTTAMVMNQFGGYFERAERMRNEAIAFAIKYAPLDENHLESEPFNESLAQRKKLEKREYCIKLVAARKLYIKALENGDYRAVCSQEDHAPIGVMGGLWSLNGLLDDAGLLSAADKKYFQSVLVTAIELGNKNARYLQKEQAINEIKILEKINKYEEIARNSMDLGTDDDSTADFSRSVSDNSEEEEWTFDEEDAVDSTEEASFRSTLRM